MGDIMKYFKVIAALGLGTISVLGLLFVINTNTASNTDQASRSSKSSATSEKSESDCKSTSTTPIKDSDKLIALTFDDGPKPESTTKILDTLKKYDVPGTFFMVGVQAQEHPDMVKKVYDAGHEVANHTMNHPNLQTSTDPVVQAQVKDTTDFLEKTTNSKIKYMRPPYGATPANLNTLGGLEPVLWNLDSYDWQSRDTKKIKKAVIDNFLPRTVLLMHDVYNESADALPDIIEAAQKQGYRFVTVSEYLEATRISGLDIIQQSLT